MTQEALQRDLRSAYHHVAKLDRLCQRLLSNPSSENTRLQIEMMSEQVEEMRDTLSEVASDLLTGGLDTGRPLPSD